MESQVGMEYLDGLIVKSGEDAGRSSTQPGRRCIERLQMHKLQLVIDRHGISITVFDTLTFHYERNT